MGPLISLICGILFSLGLVLSGMTNPKIVSGFLDVFGQWDPSLIFVMGGALIVNFICFPFIMKKQRPIFDSQFFLPGKNLIDKKLVLGALIFGVGWGIMGVCPGPGIVNLVTGQAEFLIFIIFMAIAMAFHKMISKSGPNG